MALKYPHSFCNLNMALLLWLILVICSGYSQCGAKTGHYKFEAYKKKHRIYFSYSECGAKTGHYKFFEVYKKKLRCINGPAFMDNEAVINGRREPNCILLTPPRAAFYPFVLATATGATYRLQIGNLSPSALSFGIEDHDMTVVELNGGNVQPFVRQTLHIYPGETYSVIVRSDEDPLCSYYFVITNVVTHNSATSPRAQTTGPNWNGIASRLAQSLSLKARESYHHSPQKPNRDFIRRNYDTKNVAKMLDTTSSDGVYKLRVNGSNSNSAPSRIFARRLTSSSSSNDTSSFATIHSILELVVTILAILISALSIYFILRRLCNNNNNNNNSFPNNGNNEVDNANNGDNQPAPNEDPISEINHNSTPNNDLAGALELGLNMVNAIAGM